jgi:hypothetical protein
MARDTMNVKFKEPTFRVWRRGDGYYAQRRTLYGWKNLSYGRRYTIFDNAEAATRWLEAYLEERRRPVPELTMEVVKYYYDE